MKSTEKRSLIFLHIPKTAGTSIRAVTESVYRKKEMYLIYPAEKHYHGLEELSKLPGEKKKQIKLFCGHIFYGLHEQLPQATTYFTVLRNPVERVTSFYHHVRNTGSEYKSRTEYHKKLREASRMDIHEFVKSNILSPQTSDLQTYILSGQNVGEQALKIAKENLENHFSVVGLTERFDETLVLLRKVFGWNVPFYLKKNISKGKTGRDRLPSKTLDLIKESNQMDIELYEFASRMLEEQIEKQGPGFVEEVEELKKANLYASRMIATELEVIKQYESSMSWKVTAPLRAAYKLVK